MRPRSETGARAVPLFFVREVEGVETGRATAVVREQLTPADRELLLRALDRGLVEQVFVVGGESSDVLLWLPALLEDVAARVFVTLDVNAEDVADVLTHPISRSVRLVARVFDAPWARLLRNDDQVSVGVPFRFLTWRARDAHTTTPDDYADDLRYDTEMRKRLA